MCNHSKQLVKVCDVGTTFTIFEDDSGLIQTWNNVMNVWESSTISIINAIDYAKEESKRYWSITL